LTLTPDYIVAHDVHAAVEGDEIIGFYALTLTGEGGRLVLDHLWLLPKAIGQGVGRALFAHAVERARAMGARQLEIEAEPNAMGFYERMGARIIGEHTTEIEGTPRSLPVLLLDLSGGVSAWRSAANSLARATPFYWVLVTWQKANRPLPSCHRKVYRCCPANST
jgi:predicted N-acetyltransferase YhbS